MFWRAIKNSKLLRVPELVLPFCIRLAPQKSSDQCGHASGDVHDSASSPLAGESHAIASKPVRVADEVTDSS